MGIRVGADISNLLPKRIEKGVFVLRAGGTLAVTSKRNAILEGDEALPYCEFRRLFGLKRVFLEEWNNYFCQVLDRFASEADRRIALSMSATIDEANAKIVFDSMDDLGIIVSDHDLDTDTTLKIPILAGSAKNSQAALTIEETAEPVAKRVVNAQPIRDTIASNTRCEGRSQINMVDQPVAFADAPLPDSKCLGDFRVAKAVEKHLALFLMAGRVEAAFRSIAHILVFDPFDSLMRYSTLYDQAERTSSSGEPKTEMSRKRILQDAPLFNEVILETTEPEVAK